MLEALDWLDTDDTPGPRYLVLITDGEPDTCSEPDPQNGQEQALQAAQEAHQRGIEMYVVGVSSDVGVSHLQQMANVAQGVRANAQRGQDAEAIEPIVASNQNDVLAGQSTERSNAGRRQQVCTRRADAACPRCRYRKETPS